MGILPLEKKVWLSSPTMHGEEKKYMDEAYETNWMSTVGANIDTVENEIASLIGVKYAVALSSGTAALHLAVRRAGERLFGKAPAGHGTLEGKRVMCSDMTFAATVNPVCYEGGIPVYIDTERGSWNMDPAALERAFDRYPEVKLIVYAHLYGTPGDSDRIRAIAEAHGALVVEDAAEALGAAYKGRPCGSLGDLNCISFNGNKIITGSSGGMFLTDSKEDAAEIRKWSTQSREPASWYQHETLGFNYRMSNVIAGVVRGQLPYLKEHIAQKKAIFERYKKGFEGLPVSMAPVPAYAETNSWLSCLLIDREGMCPQTRTDLTATYTLQHGRSCPTEILEHIAAVNAEGRPIWKPMHLQPFFTESPFVPAEDGADAGADIFARGLCLPSDNKMTPEEQERIIAAVRACFE